MSEIFIQRGDMVGLFFEYSAESCCYLGLAEYIGEEEPNIPPGGLADAGTFNGANLYLVSHERPYSIEKQMEFCLLETDEIVYEQEVWYAMQDKTKKLLESCDRVHEGELDDIRAVCIGARERLKKLPLVAEGFVEIHININNMPLPSNDDDFDVDDYIYCKIDESLQSAGFSKKDITIKVRSLDMKHKELDGEK